jgi:hypothetical protein
VPHAETEITAELIRDLLREQHPDLADRPLALGARGWDNRPAAPDCHGVTGCPARLP